MNQPCVPNKYVFTQRLDLSAHGLPHTQRNKSTPLLPRHVLHMFLVNIRTVTHILAQLNQKYVQFDHILLLLGVVLLSYADSFDLLVDVPFSQELNILSIIRLDNLVSILRRLLFMVLLQERMVKYMSAHRRFILPTLLRFCLKHLLVR